MKSLTGIGVSEGIAIGRAVLLKQTVPGDYQQSIEPGTEGKELVRFNQACQDVKVELEQQILETTATLGAANAEIFTAHMMMLEDPELGDAITGLIKKQHSAEYAVDKVTGDMSAMFAAMDNKYMRERAADITDVGRRIVKKLQGDKGDITVGENAIVAAHDLLPSDTSVLQRQKVLGFVTALGGRTSHTSIIARAAGLPAVVGLGAGLADITAEVALIIDGSTGTVIVAPDEATIATYKERQAEYRRHRELLAMVKELPAVTCDGRQVEIAANIGTPQEMSKVLAVNADGIGLFRTEFLFMGRTVLPTEEEQFLGYKQVLEALPGKKVIFRTLDAGGDKELSYLKLPPETNPALGLRAIRLCFAREDIFRTQLRALLRAGIYGEAYIMFPMISGIEELRRAKAALASVQAELAAEGQNYRQDIPVGIMVEIPAAAVMADVLAPEVDFFSIGTNDLVQYTVAVDRMNEQVAYLSDYFHPAVIRLIANVISASHDAGKWTGMCGEMAGDPLATILLTGLGLDEFSMSTGSALEVKSMIRKINMTEAKECAQAALKFGTAKEVKAYLQEILARYKGPEA